MSRALVALGLLWALGSGLWAQNTRTSQSPQPTAHSTLQVFVITIGQGALYFEKYGHNMLWFSDPAAGIDVAYNWGSFDFSQPGFLRRQLIGDPQYSVESIPSQSVFQGYRGRDRTIVVQRLNLTPAQKQKALEYARWNAQEENKFYRYDYYLDNCSTRVRDVIDLALGGTLKAATSTTRVPLTYKSETSRLLDDMKAIQFGVNAALGIPADRPLSIWESGFIPMRLRDALRDVRTTDSTGAQVPLVAEERTVYESTRHHERADAPRLWPSYLLVGLLIAAGFFATTRAARGSSTVDKVFRFEVAVWAFATGLLGLILLLGWAITEHVFWYRNENLLLFNPLSLFLSVLVLISIRRARWLRPAAICAVIVAILAAVAMMMKGLPGSQNNLPLILLVLPVLFASAFGLWSSAR
ncbi:MAG: DUF4105 domain-containing protein [Gemmatimonadaceae bacterium]